MRLTTITGNKRSRIDEPTESQVLQAIIDTYAEHNEVVILDNMAGVYIQTLGGWHIRYTVEAECCAYVSDKVNEDQAQDLFLSFACGDGVWETVVMWAFDADSSALLRRSDEDWDKKDRERNEKYEQEHNEECRRKLKEAKRVVARGQQLLAKNPSSLLASEKIGSEIMLLAYEGSTVPDVLRPVVGPEIDTVTQEARRLRDAIEVYRYSCYFDWLMDRPLHNIASVRMVKSMLENTAREKFLAQSLVPVDSLRLRHRQVKEKLAWFRAAKKLAEVDSAKSPDKGKKLRAEAADLLRQDWDEYFPGEYVPSVAA